MGVAMVDTYRFRVRGHLDDRRSDWLGGMVIHLQEDGTTLLVGPVVDQAALHGVIIRIRDLGLPLLSVEASCRTARRDLAGKLDWRCDTSEGGNHGESKS